MSAGFVPGLELARGFYRDVVSGALADVRHSAALLGWGSDVLGFDTARSTDHGWGPRLQVFVEAAEVSAVDAAVEAALPDEYGGWPARFGWDDTPVSKHVEVAELGQWLEERLGFDPRPAPTHRQWLAAPQQLLLELTAGAVFHDGRAELHPLRESLRWYPDDVWLWLLGCQWGRIAQEEAFVGRAAEVGDDLGARVLAARLARELIRLAFLLERRYAPYSKWLGSAFRRLDAHDAVAPGLTAALVADDDRARQAGLLAAAEELGRRHNALRITATVDPTPRPFHSRPYRVLGSDRFLAACLERVEDPWLRALPPAGGIDQLSDSADVLSVPATARRAARFYDD